MMKTQIGLGVLSIPVAFDTLGIIPGVIILCAVAAITTWSDYIVGAFKLRHREVYGIDDAGGLMFGRLGRILFGGAFVLCEYISHELLSSFPPDLIKTGSLLPALACWVSRLP